MNADVTIANVVYAFKGIKWRDCESDDAYEWYYAENMLYVIREKKTRAYWFVKAKSPQTAYECMKRLKGD